MTIRAATLEAVVHSSLDVEGAYRAYGARCYALARSIVRDPHLAQDVVHEVFAGVITDPGRFDPDRGTPATWLMTLTHHRAVDLVRQRRRQTGRDATDADLTFIADPGAGPEDAAWTSEQVTVVRAALRHLRPPEREVLVLGYFGGLSQAEIARHLGIPVGTVKSRTRLGLRHLGEHIGPHAE